MLFMLFLAQEEVGFKPSEEFEIKFNFEFKERPRSDPNRVDLDLTRKEHDRNQGSGPLPYLFLNLKVLKQGTDEVRVRILENGKKAVLNKKFDMNTILKLDLGFTDDIKDRIGPYEYQILFMSEKKHPISRIVIFFDENGTYLVNGEVRGKI